MSAGSRFGALADGPTDLELLESFLTWRDETAFEARLRVSGHVPGARPQGHATQVDAACDGS